MKSFEQIDVFMPGEESKGRMKLIYNGYLELLKSLTNKVDMIGKYGEALIEYIPAELAAVLRNYGVTLYYNEKEEMLYATLCYIRFSEEDGSAGEPLVYVTIGSTQSEAMDLDSAAYIFMVSTIAHLGLQIEKKGV